MDTQIAEAGDEILQPDKELRKGRRQAQTLWRLSLMIGDGILLFAVFVCLFVLLSYLHLGLTVSRITPGVWNTKLVWGGIALACWSMVARITHVYESLNAADRFRSVLNTLFALTLALILWIMFTAPFFYEEFGTYIKVVFLFFIVAIPVLSGWRLLFAEIQNVPRFRRKAVIVGTTAAARAIVEELSQSKRPYATILGHVNENTDAQLQQDVVAILDDRRELHGLVRSGEVDMIITAIDYNVNPQLFLEVIDMAQLGVSVIPMAVAYEGASGKIPVEYIGDQWYLALPLKVTVSTFYLCWRKVIDLIFGLIGTALLLLILPVLALLIYLDSPGPIFYRQERLGLRGKPFCMYKFRSMLTDAEQAGQAIWASEDDPRVTRIGRFMRAAHLDELPQVLNVLRGDMSLLGPRPEREEFTTKLEDTIPFYRFRLMVKPGLTGWAQVKYRYGSSENDALIKLQYDLYYIKRQSFTLDIFVILKTVVEVLLHRGT